MVFKGSKKNLAWPLAAIALFSLPAQATNTFTGGVASPEHTSPKPPEAVDDDSPGWIRNNTWSGSFDKAGDATRAAELQLKAGVNIECKEESFKADHPAPELLQQRVNDCLKAKKETENYAKDAEGIRKMQRTFAHVSRASDVAAVGAIGAVGYAQLIKKDESQAATMESVAKIQETAGYVSYATGAADFSMGAYALAAQKSKLEKMDKVLSGVSKSGMKLSSKDSALVSKIKNAAEETQKAAISHMAYGAGKVAVGYASMYLAEKNRRIADSLSSIDTDGTNTGVSASASTPYVYQGSNGTAYYQNNNPQIALPDGSATSSGGEKASANESFSSAGGGASVMPSQGLRQPSSLGRAGNGSGLGGPAGGGKPGAGAEGPLAATGETEKTKEPTAAPETGLNMGGGGGSRWGGGGGAAAEEGAPVAQVLEGPNAANSKATGVNPNSLYRDAMEGIDENQQQASMAGVSGSSKSLFQVVKLKYNKMMEVGRLQGPGAVEVRN